MTAAQVPSTAPDLMPDGSPRPNLALRLARNSVETAGGCIEWTKRRDKNGYGIVTVDQRPARAHRLAYALAHGPIPAGMYVCHRCDNPPCMNVEHLFIGTPTDNTADMMQKGRNRGGRPRGLTAPDLAAIRSRYIAGRNAKHRGNGEQLAAEFGITRDHVARIARGARCA